MLQRSKENLTTEVNESDFIAGPVIQREPIVKRIDHLIIRGANPKPLLDLLTQTLGLPVAWPVKSNPFFTSGGIHLGNMNLEVMTVERGRKVDQYWLYGMMFELASHYISLPQLAARDIPHTPPLPFVLPDEQGWLETAWSNVFLGGLLNDNLVSRTFFKLANRVRSSFWERGSYPTWFNLRLGLPLFYDVLFDETLIAGVEYNPGWYNQSVHTDLGFPGLEVVEVAEVLVGVADLPLAIQRWRKLLVEEPQPGGNNNHSTATEGMGVNEAQEAKEPPLTKNPPEVKKPVEPKPKPNILPLPSGPRVRLVADRQDQLRAMVWRVKSLNRAAQFLHQQKMLGKESSTMITIDPAKIFGLDIRLIV